MGARVPGVVKLITKNHHHSGHIKVSLSRYDMPVPCGLDSGSWGNALVIMVNVLSPLAACPSRRTGSRERTPKMNGFTDIKGGHVLAF